MLKLTIEHSRQGLYRISLKGWVQHLRRNLLPHYAVLGFGVVSINSTMGVNSALRGPSL